MEIGDFTNNTVWLIEPGHLSNMLANLPTGPMAAEALENSNALKKPDSNHLNGKLAVIKITGPLSKRRTFLTWLFGGTPTIEIGQLVTEAAADPEVSAIVLDIDSPGGTVAGTEELAAIVRSAREQKPVVAFSDGAMTSAAYWIGSAANSMIINRSAAVGSIGVVIVHADYSRMDKKHGIKTTVLRSGKFKAVGNPYEPLSDDDREVIQAELDQIYGVFINAVAENRNTTRDRVKSDMAEGRVFIGAAAVEVGLIDKIGNFTDALRLALEMAETRSQSQIAAKPAGSTAVLQGADLKKLAPAIAAVHGEETAARFEAFCAAGGKSIEDFLRLRAMIGEEKPTKELAGFRNILAGLQNDRNAGNPGDFLALVDRYQEENGCSKREALQYVMRNHQNEHKAYLKAVNQ